MSKPLDYFPYKNGAMTADGVPLERVADAVGTPFYAYSAKALLTSFRELQKGLKGLDHLICFAVECNSNIAIIKLLADAGAGVDLVSGGELFRAEVAGVPADRVVLSGVGKTPGEMASALEYGGKGIFSFNAESVQELDVLNSMAAQHGKRAQFAVRFNPDVDPKTHPYISTGLKKNKFGMTRKEILDVAKRISQYPSLDFKGLSIHIGSQLLDLSPLSDAFERARDLIVELNKILPTPITYVDLGGGIGITYKKEKSPSVEKYCAVVHRFFGAKSPLKGIKILFEPGRRITGNAGALVTEILYRKIRKEKDFLIVDAAMNDLMRPSLYGSYHEIAPVQVSRGRKPVKARKMDIVGPVCETGDCFARDRKLPDTLKQGDLVAILSAGAYGFTMASNYNSRPRVPEVLVQDGSFRVIRERENYEDLIRGENL